MQFGEFWNGKLSIFTCSGNSKTLVSWMVARLERLLDLPQVTSYDYSALLDEEEIQLLNISCSQEDDGNIFSEYPQLEPHQGNYGVGCYSTDWKVSLFETLDSLSSPVKVSILKRWRSWDKCGYLLYRTETNWDAEEERTSYHW